MAIEFYHQSFDIKHLGKEFLFNQDFRPKCAFAKNISLRSLFFSSGSIKIIRIELVFLQNILH